MRRPSTQRVTGGQLVKAGDTDYLQGIANKLAPLPAPAPAGRDAVTAPEFENHQLNLFQTFLCNRDEERERLSNAIDLWDSIPRYSVSRQLMTKERIQGRFLEKDTATFQYRGRTYTRTIYPARVKDLDGVEKDFYPSATEELVEDALRKLATEQNVGYFDKPNYSSGVVFSLYALREELTRRGHSRSYQQIVQALNILNRSSIDIRSDDEGSGEGFTQSPFLPSLTAVSRKKLKDDPQAKWAVQFHPLVTGSIDKVTYRQFNYHAMMSHDTQLARWLHKQLVLKYTFADLTKPFETRYSTIKRDSNLLGGYKRERDAIEATKQAIAELKERDIIGYCDRLDVLGPRKKLLDVVFKVWPSSAFVREVKAANKRSQDAQQTARIR